MKKINYWLALYLMFSLVFIGCNKNDDGPVITTELNNPINKFVWKGMNSWYNWQPNVANLADTKDNDTDAFYTYLNGFSDPKKIFESLLYDKGNTDRFSWFIDDYIDQLKNFQGISVSTGITRSTPIGIGNNQVIIYAQYVSPNSPAYAAGIRRGDIINAIDNEVMDENNYASVINKLYSGETIEVRVSTENEGILTEEATYTVTPTEYADNPINIVKTFDNVNGKKVGYFAYNGFRSTYNDELNAAFATFKAEGINELILDLRLNGGGSVATSSYLASMIYQNAGTQKFAELKFNNKHSNQNSSYNFTNTLSVFELNNNTGKVESVGTENINRLNTINQLYVLTSGSTASASEMIINGLKPFIPVITIGTTTYGKNVGSVTLYDSPSSNYLNESSANPSHLNAMQPIVFQIFNKNGESDYTQGFEPSTEIEEWHYWANILPFGDENEILLKTALNHIKGISSKATITKSNLFNLKDEKDIKQLNKFNKEMYIDGTFLK